MTGHERARAGGGHQAATPATLALVAAGVAFRARGYAHDPGAPAYGLEAATELGEAPERVFKTLIAATDLPGHKGLVVAIVPVNCQLDMKSLARHVHCKRAELADPALAQRVTGYIVGGISPIGQKTRLPTVLDSSALSHEMILVSGGRRGLDVELSPADLILVTSATTAAVAR
ncbi:MAG: Cys-tRNA(Pro) deacylase [Ilumatobacteraceae bacterium]